MDNIITLNLDGNVLKSKEELHSTISWQLELPDYYGHNLDALWDMLSTWSKPLSIEVTHAEQFIANLGDYADALFGLLHDAADENKEVIQPVYSYRDSRTLDVIDKVEKIVSKEELYSRTGIQKLNFNTIYQLYADKLSGKLEGAKHFLMIPAYLSYCLTGIIKNEYTNMTTTGFVNAKEYVPDAFILNKLGIKDDIFGDILMPGDVIGGFTDEMQKFCGFNSKVMFCPSHDTASAVAACPLKENSAYISSGTWSLIGIEIINPVLTKESEIAAAITVESGRTNKAFNTLTFVFESVVYTFSIRL